MKVTVENKKGLNKDLKVFVDKKTIETYINEKYEEVKKQVVLKGFRPGKVPKEILKKQFGKNLKINYEIDYRSNIKIPKIFLKIFKRKQ